MLCVPMELLTAIALAVIIGFSWNVIGKTTYGNKPRHGSSEFPHKSPYHSVMVKPTDLYDERKSAKRQAAKRKARDEAIRKASKKKA